MVKIEVNRDPLAEFGITDAWLQDRTVIAVWSVAMVALAVLVVGIAWGVCACILRRRRVIAAAPATIREDEVRPVVFDTDRSDHPSYYAPYHRSITTT
ncbi:MAG: hypothetical protein WC732_09590 [Candidatus Omnitrophota bacterium]